MKSQSKSPPTMPYLTKERTKRTKDAKVLPQILSENIVLAAMKASL